MLFGDSLTQRSFGRDAWGAIIADSLQRRCDVLNRGFGGYNSRWCRLILPKILTKDVAAEFVALTILLGTNDASNGVINPQQHVSLNEFKENLIKMIEYAISAGVGPEKIIIMTPPPVDIQGWYRHCEENHKDPEFGMSMEATGQYAQAVREVASIQTVDCVDLFQELQKEPNWENLFSDGLHFTEAGGAAVAKLLWPRIEKRIQHLPEVILPKWDQVDAQNPQNSFCDYHLLD